MSRFEVSDNDGGNAYHIAMLSTKPNVNLNVNLINGALVRFSIS